MKSQLSLGALVNKQNKGNVGFALPQNSHHHFLFQRVKVVLKPPAHPSMQLMRRHKKNKKDIKLLL